MASSIFSAFDLGDGLRRVEVDMMRELTCGIPDVFRLKNVTDVDDSEGHKQDMGEGMCVGSRRYLSLLRRNLFLQLSNL